ncbi:MAG: sigma 54-interacting transcriptional regulator [candidate division KSB1 bacterium]|nr:sigma 54-interacting transcriptional regulator [candidate division KSB1 bacterium]
MIESELFGHEKGAFTDAKSAKLAGSKRPIGGILFLDEIGDLPKELQIKLLRFLEEREFTRVGSTEPINVDVQVISATNQNLEKAIEAGEFREDLYYRLKGVQIDLPALRERKEDIPLLADYFLERLRKEGRTKILAVSDEAMDALFNFEWPGNVRELKVAIERAVLFANGRGHSKIELEDLPEELLMPALSRKTSIFSIELPDDGINMDVQMARAELAHYAAALKKANGRKTEAWKYLNLNDRFIFRRRVLALFKKYPALRREFIQLAEAYPEKQGKIKNANQE